MCRSLETSEQGQIIEKPKDLIKDPYILEFFRFTITSVFGIGIRGRNYQ
jgi:hypothetical protein